MAVAYLHELPGYTHLHAQQLAFRLEEQGTMPPAGELSHAEGPMDDGWWTFSVWESEQSAQEFNDQRLAPIMAEMGMTRPSPKTLDVHWHRNKPQGQ